MGYIPVKIPLGRVVQHPIYAVPRLLVKLMMDGLTYLQ